MMKLIKNLHIIPNHSLTNIHTLRIKSIAKFFVKVKTIQELKLALQFAKERHLAIIPIGEASNTVFCDYINALVICISIKGKRIISRNSAYIIVTSYAGENWHTFVNWTLHKQAYGLENLSLIPGTVGAAPIQNIGAYGTELADHFISLRAIEIKTGNIHTFDTKKCGFNYRDSIFKNKYANKYIIYSLKFRLRTNFILNSKYNELKKYFVNYKTTDDQKLAFYVSKIICDIRKNKLPDPKKLYNCGSFFKNPLVTTKKLQQLKKIHAEIPAHKSNNKWKLYAGWLIEKIGMKGYRNKNIGMYHKHALIVVNYGGAQKNDIIQLISVIKNKIKQEFGISLEVEPTIYTSHNIHLADKNIRF